MIISKKTERKKKMPLFEGMTNPDHKMFSKI